MAGMDERITDRARKVMQLANQEAQRFNHEYIGTEHILLGLVKEGSGVAANVLKNLDIDLRKIRLEVEKIVQTGPDMVTIGKIPHTPRAKKVIEYAIEEARNLNHNYIGTEHLLLGLVREQEGVAAQVLMNLGVQLEHVLAEAEVVNQIGGPLRGEVTENKRQDYREPEPDPEEFQRWPKRTIQAITEIEAQIEQLNRGKESAVAEQDFERAAYQRDQADRLRMKRAALIRLWRSRVRMVIAIRESGSGPGAALAAAVLAGDWSALPILADALEDADDQRSGPVRNWAEEGNDQAGAGR